MADVKNRVMLHFVWGTYDRLPKLTPEVVPVAHECVRAVGDRMRCLVIAIGGVEDHLHVLVQFATTVTIADLAQEMKGYSPRIANECFPDLHFKWQGGYGVFPVTPSLRPKVEEYIAHQQEHHQNKTIIPALEDAFTPFAARAGGLEPYQPVL